MACSTLAGRVLCSSLRSVGSDAYMLRGGRGARRVVVKAVAAPEDCNEEECAPEKEVGKVSMEWKAADTTQVVGTYPPINRKKWTGYVEKDTAGQTNIYAVEPTVYVSENVISSNTVGDSSKGSEQTALVAVGLAVGLLLGAGLVLRSVSSSSSPPDEATSLPNLSFYIQKFTPVAVPAPTPPSLPLPLPALDAPTPSSSSDAATPFASSAEFLQLAS